jgi:iron complex outermembrane receptor protein
MALKYLSILMAATAMSGASGLAYAQNAGGDSSTLGEVVVTARRAQENIQDIPVSVQAFSGEILQKNAITQFTELNKLAPGLQLSFASGARGSNAEVVLRGVKWSSASGNPAIPFYMNEVVVDPNYALLTLFDIGQIEVLRGPQGTTRGAPSISGAVTVTTRPADLNAFGGYGQAVVGSGDHTNFQGAINVPLIKDQLALRVAGMTEDSQGNRVESLNNHTDPHIGTKSVRTTVTWAPTSDVHVNLSYQYLRNLNQTYDLAIGPGSAAFTVAGNPPRVLPRNYNGPPLSPDDYKSVQDVRSNMKTTAHLWALNAQWNVLGQTVEYIGGFQDLFFGGPISTDYGNQLIGYDTIQDITSKNRNIIQELRVSSQPGDHIFDYVVGGYYFHNDAMTRVYQNAAFLPGALGPFGQASSPYVNPTAANAYYLPLQVLIPIRQVTYSFYANGTFHLPYDTELSGGLRFIHDHRPTTTIIALQNGVGALPAGSAPSCPGATVSLVYGTGFCDRVLSPARVSGVFPYDKVFTPTIWNVSLSHKFTRDLLTYFTAGTSYRGGTGNINVNVAQESLRVTNPERPTSFELGVKSSWLDNRLRLNASIYQINYKDQLTQFPGIQYRSVVDGSITQTSAAFYQNVDTRVRGFEGEFAAEPIEHLTLAGTLSWSEITSLGGMIPCNNPAVPLTATNEMNFCPSQKGQVLNTAPKFTATVNGEYVVPMDGFDGYGRLNVAYFGESPNFQYLAPADAYTLVDLFVGARSHDSGWDVQAYVKNLFNNHTLLNSTTFIGPANNSLNSVFGSTGYVTGNMTLPREVGVQVRYAFGSR